MRRTTVLFQYVGRRLVAPAWGDRVDVVRATADPRSDLAAFDALLVRPDRHIAWASDAARRATGSPS
ncbi:hypothetical protein [Sorangium sp. So ce233]|uniref:aromatic-ring hydroxylase C-terminal domain-containing protein n=1 Tax=Sorangium sp. So ce233 TaxID=3133290 RepID=UPI003F5EE4FA